MPDPEEKQDKPLYYSQQQPSRGSGYYTMVTTDGEGHSKTVSGKLGGGAPTLPPELAAMASMLPGFSDITGDLAPFFSSFAPMFSVARQSEPERKSRYPVASIGDDPRFIPSRPVAGKFPRVEKEAAEEPRYPVASIGDDPEEVAEARRLKGHPCAEEIMHCRAITGCDDSVRIRQCLVANLEKVSERCKCFLRQVEGPEKMQRALPASQKAAPAPTVHVTTASLAPETIVLTIKENDAVPPPRARAPHGGPCIFMMAATFILLALLVRACVRCCCGRKPAVMAVVVPPEQTTIVALSEPLKAEDIKPVAK